uniref:Zinc finger PMZ-type domain-containing protein n=1 Tax=Chenopodium quinoa TaxID=63459 RepID=A0A803MSB5_CHEQI
MGALTCNGKCGGNSERNIDLYEVFEDCEEEDRGIANDPEVGMTFVSGEEYAQFCHEYAFKKGFIFFTETSKLMDEYKDEDGKMQVRGCKLDHNHPIDPSCSRLMVNYRSVDEPTCERVMNLDKAGISINKSFNALLVESGGHENISYNMRDIRNIVNLERRRSRFQGDAVALEEYFRVQKEFDSTFYSAIQRDGEGRLMNAFWPDARSRASWKDFGDIITFDTTFSTNRYRMPFSPFVGVNHHGKSIVFSSALISHEDSKTFVWVFRQWLECMGKPPTGILTDQCRAIGKAVEKVFPKVPHRICLWHLLQNAAKSLGSHAKWKEIDVAIRAAVHDFLDPDEFDEAWQFIILKFGLQQNAWMNEAYEIRDRWAPGHWRGTIWAGMSSTQRSEGMNRVFKTYVSLNVGLTQFVKQYEATMKEKVEEEKILNFECVNKPLDVDKSIIVEYVFHKAYSNTKFSEVKEECNGLKDVNVNKTGCLGSMSFYKAEQKFPTPIWRKRYKSFNLSIDVVKGYFCCSCKLFEFRGILYRHIIHVLEVEDIEFIPEKYIMSRWRKDVVREYEDVRVSYHDPDESVRVQKFRELSRRNNYLASLAMHNEDTFNMYKEATLNIQNMLEDAIGIERTNIDNNGSRDLNERKVFGRHRLRPKDKNQRHLIRTTELPGEDCTKDPIDKRHTWRENKGRKSNPSEKGAQQKKKQKLTPEEIEKNECNGKCGGNSERNIDLYEVFEDCEEEDRGIANDPEVGMTFVSGEEYAQFCHEYAFKKGFIFFTETSKLMDEYKDEDGKMQVRGCKLDHNHPIDPSCSRLMVNYRSVDEPTCERVMNLDKAGISINKSFNALLVESGGHENISYNMRDIRNIVNLERRRSRFQGDAVALEEYFRVQKEFDSTFYSAIQRDGEGRLMNAFWPDARSRASWKDFGDIITFDTTFSTNRYRMPFSPFVGVNHHGKSIVFSSALISHEDSKTFVWVFRQWLECMGKPPTGILTDQCRAIGKAVEKVFPKVPHRICLWHLLQNAAKSLGSHAKWKEIDVAIRAAVHDFLDPDEFDEAWQFIILKFGLQQNAWMNEAYEIRDRWAPGHWRGTIWAGMSSTQRSEGMNRVFKTYVSLNVGLTQFVKQYEATMKEKVEEEKILNFECVNKPLDVDKSIIVEYVFHKAYSNTKFSEVKEECNGLKDVNVNKTGCLGSMSFYKAEQKFPTPIWRKRYKSFNLSIDVVKGYFCCSCKLFEFRGILYRHIIHVLEVEDIEFIPEKYIMSRWRKDVVREYEDVRVSYHDPDESVRVQKFRELSRRNNYLASLAMHNEDTFNMYKEATLNIQNMLEDAIGIERTNIDNNGSRDLNERKVFGRHRLRPKDKNQRHLIRTTELPGEDCTKDPIDKRHTWRENKGRKSNPSEKGAQQKKKQKLTPEEIEKNEVLNKKSLQAKASVTRASVARRKVTDEEFKEAQLYREKLTFRLFMRQVMTHLGPFQTGKLVTKAGFAPSLEKMFNEELDHYNLRNWLFSDLIDIGNGQRLISLPEVDDRIVKIEQPDEDENLLSLKRQRKIVFVDLTADH